VLTNSRSQATQAKAALQRGASWSEVANAFSVDEASRAMGGKVSRVTSSEYEEGLDRAAFKAKEAVLKGPLETQFGWYVFEVTRIRAAGAQSPDQAKETIRGAYAPSTSRSPSTSSTDSSARPTGPGPCAPMSSSPGVP
jgi:foldase protein PrsA